MAIGALLEDIANALFQTNRIKCLLFEATKSSSNLVYFQYPNRLGNCGHFPKPHFFLPLVIMGPKHLIELMNFFPFDVRYMFSGRLQTPPYQSRGVNQYHPRVSNLPTYHFCSSRNKHGVSPSTAHYQTHHGCIPQNQFCY
jgi:hypothetical protein